MRLLMDDLYAKCSIRDSILWYYTPMARSFTSHLPARVTVFDCMDELSLFKNAPACIRKAEAELLSKADVVFTGGLSLFEAKKHLHPNIHPMPSSIDMDHFSQARTMSSDPEQLKDVPHPRLGFAGVIDERMDVELLDQVSKENPDWHFVLVGPVVKIAPSALPVRGNIHYLGQRPYSELPVLFAGFDVALLPFAHNDSTKYISPTKTPEYLAAGRRVVSTSIRDVVRPYGEEGLIHIADTPAEFTAAITNALREDSDPNLRRKWLEHVDAFLAHNSWDRTWLHMMELLEEAIAKRGEANKSQVGTQ
jgi:UDP-galactopyranose mutase